MIEISLRASGVVTASQIKTSARPNLRPLEKRNEKIALSNTSGAKFPDAI
jgi:hypothetical protein